MRQNIKKAHKHYSFMIKGQISIDLLITLIVVIMVIGAFTIILSSFQNGQEEFFLRSQLNESSSKLATFITSAGAISDTNFTTKTLIHKVNYKNSSIQPEISIDTNYITLKLDTDNGSIESKFFFSKPLNSTVTTEGTKLVVSNE